MNPSAEPLAFAVQLRALGYDVPDGDTASAFDAWRASAMRGAERHVRADGGTTWVASGRSGASLAAFEDAAGEVVRVVPFLVAPQTCTVVHRGAATSGTDGSGTVDVSVLGAGPAGAAVALSLWTPHAAAWAAVTPSGAMLEVAVGAVGADCEFAGDRAIERGGGLAGEPFTPLGADGFVRLHGTVRAHLLRHNDVTRRAFETAVVDCGGVDVTVAVDPTALARPFRVGDAVTSVARICGPVLRFAG